MIIQIQLSKLLLSTISVQNVIFFLTIRCNEKVVDTNQGGQRK